MKICFVHTWKIMEQNHLEFLGNILVRTKEVLGDEGEIYFLYNGYVESPYLKEKGIKLHSYGLGKNRLSEKMVNPLLVFLNVRKICRKEKIDIVLNLSDHYYFFLTCLSARLAGCRCIARIAGINAQSRLLPLRRRVFKKVGQLCERLSLSLADHVLCLSNSLKELLVERGNNPDKISVICQGVDLEAFRPRQISEVEKSPRRLLFVGRIAKSKGVEDCIRAYLRLKKSHYNLELIICGHGPEKSTLLKKYGNVSNLIFKGFVPRENLPEIYFSSDILLLPSYSEGMPNVILEAMACRLPVIASNTGEIPRLLGNGKGILILSGDVDELVAAVKTMIVDHKFRVNSVKLAYSSIITKYSYGAVRSATLELFKSYERNNGELSER